MLRKLTKDDINKIMEIENKVFTNPFTKEDYLRDAFMNPYSIYKVLIINDEIIGFYGIWITFDNAEVITIAVNKDYQGKGYGQVMMDDILNECKVKDVINLTLEVRVSNIKAIKLYERNYFKNATLRKNYYPNGEDAYLMHLQLKNTIR